MDISETRPIGTTGLEVTAFGLGCASFGGLYAPLAEEDIFGLLAAAWDGGVRYFDVAPMYGLGRAEHLLGHFLRERIPADAHLTLSTKAGRLMSRARPGRELPPEPPKNPFDAGWGNGLNFREVFDYSYDGIMRSFDDSQQRLGRPEIDIVYVHDIGPVTHGPRHDVHWRDLTSGGFRALEDLRAAGLIKGFGLGVNETGIIADAMNEADLDCCLLAGRYSLLDQEAAPLLDKARGAGVSMILGGVFNSGILAGGPLKFNYVDAPDEIVARVEALSALCAGFDVPLGAAAIQYPMRHAGVTSVLVGARTARDVTTNLDWFRRDIPDALWSALDAAG
ncbi:aldo/keto reductase [Roseisalinus antarcticus]|uniref:Pyridoxal 4-dehydrogenase n=1 Tax=Roseisalinus antarcticus TaxID=254357 RepID=A0A1Y5RIC5_9RHOB|nr:aldo/keto reductase [Roseisalinus antarcticus]SLN17943.1 Pyridoxal 4-dehydrogenase [Roseisalinus antarcticus]